MSGIELAHGIGGAQDLPLPPSLAISGAAAALLVSFVVLAYAWKSPRFATSTPIPAPRWLDTIVSAPAFGLAARLLGLAVFGYAIFAAVFGPDLQVNPFFGLFYVFLWVVPVFASLLLGPFWRSVSPARSINTAIARLTGGDPERGAFAFPAEAGHWPAALGLFAYVWLELVYLDNSELAPVRLWFMAYVAAMLLGGVLFGNQFYAYADPFEVYSTLIGRLSGWTRIDAPADEPGTRGRLAWQNPLALLAQTPPAPGLLAVVSVLLGSTAFDSFSGSAPWRRIGEASPLPQTLLGTLGLLLFCAVVAGLVAFAAAATQPGDGTSRAELPNRFAHSVVPIVAGYIVAHYLTFTVHVGQATLAQLSDPLLTGADWFGTADWGVNYWLAYHPTLVAVIKVLAVVTGHVLGVISAHDRSLEVLPISQQIRGQLPLLVVMICFTVGGLYLLFAT
ncbi:MAG: hypothetical protein WAW88_16285 [Nocardioides sp.]